jgi:hypothetical protein
MTRTSQRGGRSFGRPAGAGPKERAAGVEHFKPGEGIAVKDGALRLRPFSCVRLADPPDAVG